MPDEMIDGPDCRLRVRVRGAGDPVSVWAHGLTSSVEEIQPFSAGTKGTRILFDLRGHGRSESPPPEAGYDHEAMLRDIRFVADRYGATRAFGVSVSADALVRDAAREPARFERLALMIPSSIDEPNEGAAGFPAMADALESMPLEQFADDALQDPVYGLLFDKRPKWRRLVRSRILRMNGIGVPRALRAYRDAIAVPEPDELRLVTAPVLVLAHEHDPIHEATVARRLASLFPNATLRVWDEPLAMLDDMPGFAALVGRFMSA